MTLQKEETNAGAMFCVSKGVAIQRVRVVVDVGKEHHGFIYTTAKKRQGVQKYRKDGGGM